MDWSDEDQRRVGAALLAARRKLQSLGGDNKPDGSDVIFQVIKELVDIERRMKVRVASPKHLRAQLIEYIHDPHEREEAAKQRRIDEAAGDDPAVVWGITLITTPEEVKNQEAITRVFRQLLVGKNKVRDWKILHQLGEGKPVRDIARRFHIGKSRVSDLKYFQCAAIWTRLSHLVSVKDTGRIWHEAA